jgi:solute carrier family 27 fatty acid transporter 1/4
VGACGYIPLINRIQPFVPLHIIRIDEDMVPIRDENGFCIQCKPNEKGVLISLIGNIPTTQFNGYLNNPKETNKKIVHDVFKKGQRAYFTGDLLMCDSLGYVYFCDRLGDTFRWRGENVATVEVENVISKHLNSAECFVYGVQVPGQEGRAGMASIKSDTPIDLTTLAAHLKSELPVYARPIFLRLVDELDHTGTFKAQKNKASEQGFNIRLVKDRVFYYDAKWHEYLPLTDQIYQEILDQKFRL